MHNFALEIVQSWNGRPRRVAQDTLPRNKYLGKLISSHTIMLNSYLPNTVCLHPPCIDHFRIKVDVSIQIPLSDRFLNIGLYLGAGGIELGPVWVWIEGEGINVCCVPDQLAPFPSRSLS